MYQRQVMLRSRIGFATPTLLLGSDSVYLIRLYRSNSSANLWQHTVLGSSGNGRGHWSTGNAWAAAGMLRVLEPSSAPCTLKF
ncbi:hypothetical protein BGY98DRAFT_993692 [Russula aff. rugulosa BPL654]|nr:hypothetical protein BGY98DRAFT_993692 [Russula aff. rugulosa BPL654]